MRSNALLSIGITLVTLCAATNASAYGILASENGTTIEASRVLVVRNAPDELQLIAQIKLSNASSPAVWLIPIERKTSTQIDDNREVTVEGFSSSTLDQLNLLSRPQLKPMCDGMEAGVAADEGYGAAARHGIPP